MKSILLILVTLFILSACATHYIPSTCPTVGNPPVMSEVKWVRICIVGDKPDNVVCFRAPASEADINKLRANFKMKDIYITDCFDKIGEPAQ
jgi:hypothetical protein